MLQTPAAFLWVLTVLLSGPLPAQDSTPPKPKAVRAFVLAGQSNMEGKAPDALLEAQAEAADTREFFAKYRKDGRWIERDDVWITYLKRRGRLSKGYGSPGRTGLELAFGSVVGDHMTEPVLLIKAAWGGRSLVKDFRPPSAGLPEDLLAKDLRDSRNRVEKENQKRGTDRPLPTLEEVREGYGADYRAMMEKIAEARSEAGNWFPELKGLPVEIDGFVWFQGWNDQYGGQDAYAENLACFIRDVRKDLGKPQLPFVIGVMGQNGSKPASGAMKIIQDAQESVASRGEFQDTVRAVRTDVLVDTAAEALYPRWKEEPEAWKRTGGDHPYHYLGSAIWFCRIGEALGRAMIALTGP